MPIELLPRETGWSFTLLAWSLTYLIHSTLLLGGVWTVTRLWRGSSDALSEALWKLALLGGVASATLQLGAGLDPFGGTLALRAHIPATESQAPSLPATLPDSSPDASDELALSAVLRQPAASQSAGVYDAARRVDGGIPARTAAGEGGLSPQPAAWRARGVGAGGWLPFLVALAALLGCLPLLLAWRRVRAFLAGRREVTDAAVLERADRLRRIAGLRRPVRITCSDRIAAPIALGVVRKEICLPPRALDRLGPAQQEAMLAHEMAHHLRRDPAWLAGCKLLETLLCFQPLNRVARARLRELAEYRCDAWAASQTGNALSLARCLAEVAEWLLPPPARALAALPAMAASPSQLACRIQRLLAAGSPTARANRTHGLLAALLLVPLTLLAPGVRASAHRPAAAESRPGTHVQATPSGELAGTSPELAGAIQSLGTELAALDSEIATLGKSLAALGADGELRELLDRLEDRAQALRERRAALGNK